jgi:polyisoprenoid-binding protein YceI
METVHTTAVHYVIDTRASRFTVQAFSTGLLSAMGHNPTITIRGFSGQVNFSPETFAGNNFRLAIQTNSAAVEDDISDKDRGEIERVMNDQVLEPGRYPEIVYEAPNISVVKMGDALGSATLNGSLTFHGVTRNLEITARVAVFGDMLRASGGFALKQTDYQIKPISFAGGALKLKDDLKFSFEIVARGQG